MAFGRGSKRNCGRNEGEAYLKLFPDLAKWLNTCATCRMVGYKPDLPEKLGSSFAPSYLRRWFKQLELDEHGRFPECAASIAIVGAESHT